MGRVSNAIIVRTQLTPNLPRQHSKRAGGSTCGVLDRIQRYRRSHMTS